MHLLIQKQWIDQVRIHFDAHFTYVLPSTQSQSPRSSVFTLPLFEYYPNGVNPLSLCTHQYEYNGFVFNSDFNFMQIITITHQDPKNIVRCSLTLRHLNSRYVYYTHALLPFKTLGMSITPTLYSHLKTLYCTPTRIHHDMRTVINNNRTFLKPWHTTKKGERKSMPKNKLSMP